MRKNLIISRKKFKFLTVHRLAKKWQMSERSIRNYCSKGKFPGAFILRGAWMIPEDVSKPERKNKKAQKESLLNTLLEEKHSFLIGGVYYRTQVYFTYCANKTYDSSLTFEQLCDIFENRTVFAPDKAIKTDDIIRTAGIFRCIDNIIETAGRTLTRNYIMNLHTLLGFSTSRRYSCGKILDTLLKDYNKTVCHELEDILELFYRFISPNLFKEETRLIGHLIIFKECLKNNICPFGDTDKFTEMNIPA